MKAVTHVGSLLVVFAGVVALPGVGAAQVIVVDPGHGGNDPGGTGNGLQEKNIVLDTSLRFRDLLNADTADPGGGGAWTVHLTRETDVFISLSNRSSFANSLGADRFMSIHANAHSSSSANGTETFSSNNTGTAAALRNLVQEEMIAAWGRTNRGNKTKGFSVLVNTSMPAVLHELAFITNAAEAAILGSADARQKAAEAHLRAIQRHYGMAPYVPGQVKPVENGWIEVTVTASHGPARGAEITLDGEPMGLTDENGKFAARDLAPTQYLVGVSLDGFTPGDKTVTVASAAAASVEFALRALAVEPEPEPEPSVPPGGDPNLRSGCNSAGTGGLTRAAIVLFWFATKRRRRNGYAQRLGS